MITFVTTLQKFAKQGEKTGWTYIIPFDLAEQLKPNHKKSFRVKGKIDGCAISGISLLPMGEGNFIMAINATIRKKLKKVKGDTVILQLEEDTSPILLSADLITCLEDDKKALAYFKSLPKSHQNYYSKWIESAKTPETKAKRILQTLTACNKEQSYGEMMRENKAKNI